MKNTNRRSERTLLFLAGIAAGAATTYFLNTPKGKELRKVALNKTNELKDSAIEKGKALQEEIVNTSHNVMSNLKDKAATAMNYASSTVDKVSGKVNESILQMAETVDETTDDFSKGVHKAKTKIENRIKS